MIRIVVIAALTAGLAACGGDSRKTAQQPERAAAPDWRPSAERICEQVADPLVSRAWFMDLREMRRRLPKTVRDVREAIAETARLPGRPDQQFVADMGALDPQLAKLARAGRAMNVGRLDRAITGLQTQLRAVAGSARRAGLHECLGGRERRLIDNGLRAPVAAEQLSRLVRRANERVRAAGRDPSLAGLRDAVAAWEAQNVAGRKLKVPATARRERARWLAATRHYTRGLDELADRYEAGLYTSDARYDALIPDRLRKANRRLDKLYDATGAHPTGLRD